MRIASTIVLACGAAASLPVFADPAPVSAGRPNGLRAERTPVGPAVTPRGGFGGHFVTMRHEFENFPTNTSLAAPGLTAPPTSFTGPPGFGWAVNTLRGQSIVDFAHAVDLSGTPVGGANGVVNGSRAVRVRTHVKQPPNGFYLGAALRFGAAASTGWQPITLTPSADHHARVSAEYFASTLAEQYTFEVASPWTLGGVGRILWGGTCTEDAPGDCTDIGLPIGAITSIYRLGLPCDWGVCRLAPARYCLDANENPVEGCIPPNGVAVGDHVSPPIATWARFSCETSSDWRVRFFIDLFDGNGETLVVEQFPIDGVRIGSVGAYTAFESQDAFLLIDNVEASGELYGVFAGPPLGCPYLDDMEWLATGPLLAQSFRWDAAPTSSARVIADGARVNVIQQINNISSDNEHRRELSTELPAASATLGNDLVATVQVRTTGATVRAFALFNGDELAARVLFGRQESEWSNIEPRVYAQINPHYDPIDDPSGSDPFVNLAAVGVDVADTNDDWQSNGVYRTLELRLSANGALRVSIDGQRIYAGAGAFLTSLDRFAFESENNFFGSASTLRINDVTLTCDAPSCAADFDFDDTVTFSDLNAVLGAFGSTGLPASVPNPGDANADGAVDFADLNAVLAAFGTSCD